MSSSITPSAPKSPSSALQTAIWQGSLPLSIRLAPSECRIYDQADPYLVGISSFQPFAFPSSPYPVNFYFNQHYIRLTHEYRSNFLGSLICPFSSHVFTPFLRLSSFIPLHPTPHTKAGSLLKISLSNGTILSVSFTICSRVVHPFPCPLIQRTRTRRQYRKHQEKLKMKTKTKMEKARRGRSDSKMKVCRGALCYISQTGLMSSW